MCGLNAQWRTKSEALKEQCVIAIFVVFKRTLYLYLRFFCIYIFFEHLARWQVEALRGARLLPHGAWGFGFGVPTFGGSDTFEFFDMRCLSPVDGFLLSVRLLARCGWPTHVAKTRARCNCFAAGASVPYIHTYTHIRGPIRSGVHIKFSNCFFLAAAVRLSLFPYWSFCFSFCFSLALRFELISRRENKVPASSLAYYECKSQSLWLSVCLCAVEATTPTHSNLNLNFISPTESEVKIPARQW